jgi:hypothetical protein
VRKWAAGAIPRDTRTLINMEWGAFRSGHLPRLAEDEALDAEFPNTGGRRVQRGCGGGRRVAALQGACCRAAGRVVGRCAELGALQLQRLGAGGWGRPEQGGVSRVGATARGLAAGGSQL